MNNGRMSMVYDGKVADSMNKNDLIAAIISEAESHDNAVYLNWGDDDINKIKWCMEEAFRCGFLRGEEYAKSE